MDFLENLSYTKKLHTTRKRVLGSTINVSSIKVIYWEMHRPLIKDKKNSNSHPSPTLPHAFYSSGRKFHS